MIFGSLALADSSLCPPWMPPQRPAFVYVRDVEPPPPRHRVLLSLVTRGGSLPLAVEIGDGERRLLFDASDCHRLMSGEEYYEFPRPRFALPMDYHLVPPPVRHFLLGRFSRAVARLRGEADAFPRWPVEESLEFLGAVLAALGLDADWPARIPWPQGKKAAFCVTHDVDTGDAQGRVGRIHEVEAALGVNAGWFFTTGAFTLDHGLLRSLHDGGGEIASHDSCHDMRTPFQPPAIIRERLLASREALEPYGVRGYRAPGLVRSAGLYREAASLFSYDSSCPDTDALPGVRRPGGCLTVFPFMRTGMLVLPVTLPQDIIYILRGWRPREILASMRAKIRWIKAVGGMVMLLTHPDEGLGGSESYLGIYRKLLEEAVADSELWHALPRQVAAHANGLPTLSARGNGEIC